jgi:hypothetical protein
VIISTFHRVHVGGDASQPGAGTDANVTVVLRGTKGETGRCLLSRTERDFERGTTDTFVVEAQDVGLLTAVTIGHDNYGSRASWHLDQVCAFVHNV